MTIVPVPIDEPAAGRDRLLPFLLLAVNWSMDRPALDAEAVLADPALSAYVDGWGRSGDLGMMALAEGEPIGAAWIRRMDDPPGFGWVADDIPELSIAVDPGHQGEGIGRALLRALIQAARMSGERALSLAVEEANGAAHLYEQEGFAVVGRNGASDVVLLDLDGGADPE